MGDRNHERDPDDAVLITPSLSSQTIAVDTSGSVFGSSSSVNVDSILPTRGGNIRDMIDDDVDDNEIESANHTTTTTNHTTTAPKNNTRAQSSLKRTNVVAKQAPTTTSAHNSPTNLQTSASVAPQVAVKAVEESRKYGFSPTGLLSTAKDNKMIVLIVVVIFVIIIILSYTYFKKNDINMSSIIGKFTGQSKLPPKTTQTTAPLTSAAQSNSTPTPTPTPTLNAENPKSKEQIAEKVRLMAENKKRREEYERSKATAATTTATAKSTENDNANTSAPTAETASSMTASTNNTSSAVNTTMGSASQTNITSSLKNLQRFTEEDNGDDDPSLVIDGVQMVYTINFTDLKSGGNTENRVEVVEDNVVHYDDISNQISDTVEEKSDPLNS